MNDHENRPIRVLHVIDTLDRASGGPVAGVVTLVEHCNAAEMQIEVVSLDLPEAKCVADFPATVYALGEERWFSRYARRFRYSAKLVPWLRENAGSYDYVVVNGIWCYHTIAVGKALRGSKTPYLVFTHGMLDPWFKQAYPLKHLKKQIYWSLFLGRVLTAANYVMFTAEDEKLLARGAFAGYHNFRERVIRYGPNDVPAATDQQKDAFRRLVPELAGRPYLLFLSRIHPKKGCDQLIEAFAQIANHFPEWQLVMAGPDHDNWQIELAALAERLGVSDRVHWLGMIGGDAKWGAFRGADAFILPSHQENFGIAVAEAMACGKPVLISNKINIWREILVGGGGMVANDDLPGTTNLIERFMALAPAERIKMGQAARRSFLNDFCGDRFAEDMLKVAADLKRGG